MICMPCFDLLDEAVEAVIEIVNAFERRRGVHDCMAKDFAVVGSEAGNG